MSITLTIDPDKQLAIFKVRGRAGFDEIMAAVSEFYSGAVTRHVIWDGLEADFSEFTREHVQMLAEFKPRYSERRAGGKTALVMSKDLAYGLARMYEIFGELNKVPVNVEVFRNIEDAMHWIDEG